MRQSKNNPKRNKIQVNLINSGLRDLKGEIEEMRKQEKETENPHELVGLAGKILSLIDKDKDEG